MNALVLLVIICMNGGILKEKKGKHGNIIVFHEVF